MAKKNALELGCAAPASHDPVTSLAPLGLLIFGTTTALVNLYDAGLILLDAMFLGMGVLCGGLGQILVAVMEWKKENSFGATVFTSYGLFWLSLIALVVLPKAGWGQAPQAMAMAAYLIIWGLFSAVLFGGALRLSRALRIVFGLLVTFFFLTAIGVAAGSVTVKIIAGYEGSICGLAAIYAGLAQVMNEMYGRTVAPLGAAKQN